METPQLPTQLRCAEPPSPFLCCAHGGVSPGFTGRCTPWESCALCHAEVPKPLVDTALDAPRLTPVQAAAED